MARIFAPKIVKTDDEIEQCYELMLKLRPHLQRDEFVARVKVMQAEGYCLLALSSEDEPDHKVVALAGYRISHNLFMGKNLYVDDLITSINKRSKGYGEQLLKYLRALAIEEGCHVLHLDSGTHRGAAHKFYFNQGLAIASYHFSESLDND